MALIGVKKKINTDRALLRPPMITPLKPGTISATAFNRQSGQILYRVAAKREHLIIERDGIPLVVVIPLDDYKRFVQRVPVRVGGRPRSAASDLNQQDTIV